MERRQIALEVRLTALDRLGVDRPGDNEILFFNGLSLLLFDLIIFSILAFRAV